MVKIATMGRTTTPPLPAVRHALTALGEQIRLARLRRGISAALLAERAGLTRTTLRAVERGTPSVTLGAYANVLHILGMVEQLAQVGAEDPVGRHLQDAALESRGRVRPRRKSRGDGDKR